MTSEYIPSITVGRTRYVNYPIREMSRHEAEALLRHSAMRYTIVVRVSRNARQETPFLYYVMSYIPLHHKEPIHVIVTHESHKENISLTLPYSIETHQLLLLPHHPAYSKTQTERIVSPYLAPRIPAEEDSKEEPGAPSSDPAS